MPAALLLGYAFPTPAEIRAGLKVIAQAIR
jgi:DNA-binding transcriptional MocR family regulator